MSWLVCCDGCGKQVTAQIVNGNHVKNKEWFSRKDEKTNEIMDACSLDCIGKINLKTGKEAPVQK